MFRICNIFFIPNDLLPTKSKRHGLVVMLLVLKPFGYNWQLLVIDQLKQSLQHPGLNGKKTQLMPI